MQPLTTTTPTRVLRQKAEVWIAPSGDLFEAVPLFTRMATHTDKYKIEIAIESPKPMAYAIYHPEMSENYIIMAAHLIQKKGIYVGEL